MGWGSLDRRNSQNWPWIVDFVEYRRFRDLLAQDVDVHNVGADILRHELDVEQPVVVREAEKRETYFRLNLETGGSIFKRKLYQGIIIVF